MFRVMTSDGFFEIDPVDARFFRTAGWVRLCERRREGGLLQEAWTADIAALLRGGAGDGLSVMIRIDRGRAPSDLAAARRAA